MEQRANFIDEGIDRFQEAWSSVEDEFEKRRKSFSEQTAKRVKEFESTPFGKRGVTFRGEAQKQIEVDLFLFHQANLRINEFVAQKLEIPADKIYNNIQHYGNCSAASIPILLHECQRDSLIERGQLVSMTAFGSGFTWASAEIRF